ncbi:EF-hand domain-containing protein [Devosia faecipullorum]|uniref:EF-hand domain-containing protein n=1 Tax=Devosia faecipullorum TaxID=2755039 RepID=UPI00187B3DD8|nr:EF-hand domain-containing protein [Devosia faecipullorum]MBE7732732.1 EF-hand domain-containing protein [Devosia faecipullorum]
MRRIVLTLAALTLGAMPALAQTPLTFAQVDSDANGELSYEELRAVWTDFTEDEFVAADLDASGGLSPDELNALQKSALPAPGGE